MSKLHPDEPRVFHFSHDEEYLYPSWDGEPIADNTLQYGWIAKIEGSLEFAFRNDPMVFVAGDNFIYPVVSEPANRHAPDIYVAFGRPKHHRGSYRVWEEGGIFPQVVFEILSPRFGPEEMTRRRLFYEDFGAEEYYEYDPDLNNLVGYRREGRALSRVPEMNGFVSPRLGARFDTSGPKLEITDREGIRFMTFGECAEQARKSRQQIERDIQRAEKARQETEGHRRRADHYGQIADNLAAKLRELGVDPDAA